MSSTTQFKIREATIQDAGILAAAEQEIAKTPGRLASRPHELKESAFQEKIVQLSNNDRGKYVVLESDGKIIGHALLDPGKLDVTAHVVDLTIVIHEGYQGRGYGKALMSYIIQWAQSNPKIEKIMLHVRSSNKNAIALYEKMGFQIEGVREKMIKLSPKSYLDNIAMALWVGEK